MLDTIDLSKRLTREEYVPNLIRYQLQLRELAYQLYVQQRTLIMVYEGWDVSPNGSTRGATRSSRSPRPRGKTAPITICGASGAD
jgi:polyphosphate kinase 2 (PPK2 family)